MLLLKLLQGLFLIYIMFCSQQVIAENNEDDYLGVFIPKELRLDDTNDKVILQGTAANIVNGDPVYVAAFFSSKIEKKPEMILISELSMAMFFYFVQDDLNPGILKKLFIEEIVVNNFGWDNDFSNRNRLLELEHFLEKTFNAGDIITFEYASNDNLTMKINGQITKVWHNSRSFFNAILRIWIGPYPPTREFKEGILGT